MADVDAPHLEHTTTGSGPGVLLVHGTGASKDTNWGEVPQRLAERFTVTAVNLPGSGASALPDGAALTPDGVVDQLAAVVRAAGTGPVHVVGYSLGAALAIELAASRPETVASLTPVAGYSAGTPRLEALMELWQLAYAADVEVMVRLLLHTGMGPLFWENADRATVGASVAGFTATLAPGFAEQALLNTRVNTRSRLGSIAVPTLAVGLTHDEIVPPEHSRGIAAAIPGARYAEVAGGHLAPWENPAGFADVIVEHLGSLER